MLSQRGYHKIEITDTSPPTYHATACREGAQYRLSIDETGEILDRDRIRDCDGRPDSTAKRVLDPGELETFPASRGYKRIDIIDRSSPYKVEACKDGERVKLVLDKYARIDTRLPIGDCDRDGDYGDRAGLESIRDQLRSRDFYDVRFVDKVGHDRVVVEACRADRRFRLELDDKGEVLRREPIGSNCGYRHSGGPQVAGWRQSADVETADRLRHGECEDLIRAITKTSAIRFETGSDQLKPETRPLLRRIASIARRCDGSRIQVSGFTDSVGDPRDNLRLSRQRAEAVVEALAEFGVDRWRLRARGFGDQRPLTTGDTPTERALNRRIEFRVSTLD